MVRPVLLLLAALLVLSAAGAAILSQPSCSPRDARDAEYFVARVVAECLFDSVSAACGCGLVAGPLDQRYSPAGLWVLWSVGVVAALSYLVCGVAVLQRLFPASAVPPVGTGRATQSIPWRRSALVCSTALALFTALALGVYFAGRAACPTVQPSEAAWLVGSAFFSLGLTSRMPDSGTALMLAFVGLIGALGWPVWLFALRPVRRQFRELPIGRAALLYIPALTLLGGLVCVLEQPRGGESIGKLSVAPQDGPVSLAREPLVPRFARSLVAVTNAATTGIGTEPLTERGLRDGSKAVLAGATLLGGLLGGPGGGVTITLLLFACLRRAAVWRVGCARIVATLVALTVVVALGLLALEALVASRYQPPPTFADALLEAGSAVGGGGLSSGLMATVTARNLVSGIGLGLSQYQIGMFLLMAAMVAGRVLPLAILARLAARRED